MASPRNFVVPAGLLVLVCAVAAYEVYAKLSSRSGPPPVTALTAAPASSPNPGRAVAHPPTSPSPGPEVFVVDKPGSGAGAARNGAGSATVAVPTTVPLAGSATSIPDVAARIKPAYVAPPPPVIEAPNAAPQIISMSISSGVVHSGETVSGNVETSTNVASVEARIGGYSSNLLKTGAGRFTLRYRVPFVPFFLKKTYTVRLIARNTRGDAVSTTFPITVR
ncbi:MAG TPA: hypothetical protein VGZ02_04785 [Candidatus Baltobacteraceae bacterium]|jgi:hypothetical protein|nr:hypothetical protein [Candidatus Baltobacteraceae bacterium]